MLLFFIISLLLLLTSLFINLSIIQHQVSKRSLRSATLDERKGRGMDGSIGFVAVLVIIVMATVVRGLMRTVPDDV